MHFTLIMDHLALKALEDKAVMKEKLLFRAKKITQYDFDMVYWAGKKTCGSQFLSIIYLIKFKSSAMTVSFFKSFQV